LCHLPALRHLELPGRFAPLLEFWLRQPAAAAAAQLTYLDLDCMSARDADLGCLAACSGLRELVVQDGDATRPLHLPGDLSRLTAVTSLGVLWWAQPELPHVVWRLTQLRHLSLQRSNVPGSHLPSDISRLRQLQQLDLGNTNVQELPQELGAWLPQLEGLDIGGTYVGELPQGLTSLTCLTRLEAAYSNMVQVQSLTGLVGLKVLDLTACQLRPPLQPLNHLGTLDTLHLQLALDLSAGEVETVAIPGPLPALRSFTLGGDAPLRVGQLQVVAGAQQLTQLTLRDCLDADQFARLGQLGVLPRLRRLCLGGHGQPSWAAALPWVTQQPHLVSLTLVGCTVEGPDFQQLPPQLEDLCLDKCALSAAQPAELTQLSQLRTLSMMHMGLQRLPPWLASLQRLEVLWLHSLHCTADFNTWRQPCPVQEGWEVLVQLPLLRQVCAPNDDMEPRILQHVPHLCWR
jgi:Leucine-rich repeat (LRR) protein